LSLFNFGHKLAYVTFMYMALKFRLPTSHAVSASKSWTGVQN